MSWETMTGVALEAPERGNFESKSFRVKITRKVTRKDTRKAKNPVKSRLLKDITYILTDITGNIYTDF